MPVIFAMHIMEGYLPAFYCLVWFLVALPFCVIGIWHSERLVPERRSALLLLGAAGGFCFVLSALKLPSVTGSCSHPTGIGLGAILFGPWVMGLIGTIVLVFQATLLAGSCLCITGELSKRQVFSHTQRQLPGRCSASCPPAGLQRSACW